MSDLDGGVLSNFSKPLSAPRRSIKVIVLSDRYFLFIGGDNISVASSK